MTLQSSAPLTLNEIKTEFGNSSTLLTSYYRGGGSVPNHEANANIPTSGNIKVLDFLNTDKTFRCSMTSGSYSTGGIVPVYFYGYSKNLDGYPGTSFGSLSGYTYLGVSGSSLDQAIIGGLYGFQVFVAGPGGGGGGNFVYNTVLLLEGGDYTASSTWTSLTVSQSGSVTLTRAGATSATYFSSGNYTKYTWMTLSINGTGAISVEIV